MANYSIQRSDLATGNITVTEASTNTATNVTLIGQNFTGYGDEIATNFLQMLENFASDVAPTANPRVVGSAIRGQLWYDTTLGTGVLKVHDGSDFQQIAKINTGTTESSTLRWNNVSGRYQPEERVRVSDAGALIVDAAAAGTNAVTISHDTTDLNIVGAGTTDINITSGITAVNLSSITLVTALAEIEGGTGTDTYATGDVLYASGANTLAKLTAGANGEVLTMGVSVPSWEATGAGVTTLTTLTDVDTSGVVTGSLMYKTAGDWTDTPGLTWNVIAGNLSATRFGNILEANLVDKAASETIAGAWVFSNAAPINATAGDLLASNGNGLSSSDAATAIAIRADNAGGQIDFTHSGTPDWNIEGLGIITAANPIHATSVASVASFRSIGDANGYDVADSYMSFYDSDQSDRGMDIGTLAADGFASRINARLGNLKLYANATLTADISSTTTTWTSNTVTSLVLRAPLSISGATTTATVGDVTSSQQYNVGYNESPTANHVLEDINTGSRIIDKKYIGKFISRTTSTSRSVTLNIDSTIPVGASVLIHNGSSSGTLTIVNGTITNLDWIDGSGALPTRTSNRDLDYNSICTIRKVNETTWQIWGNGIT